MFDREGSAQFLIMIFPCFNNDFDQIYIGHTFLPLDASIEKLCTSFPIKHITIVNHESIYCICFSLVEGSDVMAYKFTNIHPHVH
jgi:hypothetical protein